MNTSPGGWIIAAAAAAAAVFVLDVFIPLGIAVPMLYVFPIMLTGLVPVRHSTMLVVGTALLLTWIGAAFSPSELSLEALTNRVMASALLLAIGWLLLIHEESAQKIVAAQQARDVSEERLRLAQSAEGFGTFDWDIPGQKVIWSPETEQIWGLPVGGFEGTYEHWLRLVHPDDVVEAERMARLALEHPDASYSYDHRIVRPNGTVRWIHAKATTVHDAAGRPIRMVGVNTDITDRKQAEERLRLFIEQTPVALAMFDRNMRYLAASRRWREDYGLSDQPIIGRSHYDIFPDIPDRWKDVHRRGVAGEIVRADEDRFVRAAGTEQWLRWEVRPWHVDGHLVGGILIFTEDITERKRAEAARRESEDRFRSFFENAAVGAAQINAEGRFINVNDRLCQITGYSRDELLKMGPLDLDHPDEVEADRKRIKDFFHSNAPYLFYEKRYAHKAGHVVWVRVTVAPIRDDRGIVFATAALIEDITEREQAEARLHQSEARFRTMAQAVPSFLFETDAEGWNIWTSPGWCQFTGQIPEQVAGHGWAEALHPDDRAANIDRWMQCMKDAVPFGAKQRLRRVDGSYAWVIARALPVHDDQGKVTRWVGSVTDVDAIARAEEQLRQLNETLEQRVAERTAELMYSNERLYMEITERKQVENALHQKQIELQQSQAQLQDLTAKLFTAQDSERQRIARDLHDDFSQRLAAVAINVASLQRKPPLLPELIGKALAPIRTELEELANDLHDLAHRLHPPLLRHLGLQAAIEDYLHKAIERTGLRITLRAKGVPNSIPLDWSICLFRVLQEGLQNVAKHAEATEVQVRLSGSSRGIGLSVIDNGKGFDARDKSSHQKGLGVTSMQERLRLLNGFLNIHSRPADGTKVCAWIPFQEQTS